MIERVGNSRMRAKSGMELVDRCVECDHILPEERCMICEQCEDYDGDAYDPSKCFNRDCSNEIEEREDFCPSCKEDLREGAEDQDEECEQCGEELGPDDFIFCKDCNESRAKEYRCVHCGSIHEGTWGDVPSCDNCDVELDEVEMDSKTEERDEEGHQEEVERTVERVPKKVYVMKTAQYTKVGISKSPPKRRRAIQSHTPLPVELVNTIRSDQAGKVERVLHTAFEEYRTKTEREWFKLPKETYQELVEIDHLTLQEAQELFEKSDSTI